MASSRVIRGRETEELVACWFRHHGWPDAQRVPASLPGKDILGTPGLSFEVKSRREMRLEVWLREAESRDGLPILIHRPDGFGAKSVRLLPATMRLETLTDLLGRAGYGSQPDDGQRLTLAGR